MASKKSSTDKWKKIAAAALGSTLVGMVVYNFFLSGGEPPARKAQNANASAANGKTTAPVQTAKQAEAAAARQGSNQQQVVFNTSPLEMTWKPPVIPPSKKGDRGNIFAFWEKPIPPPVEQPKPPITLQSVVPQTAVAGTPRAFTISLSGSNFPPDAQVFLDGAPRPGKRVNANMLSIEITPGDYAVQRQMTLDVKSQSEPAKFWSNAMPFIVQPAPEPPFKYVGRIGDTGLFEMAGTKEMLRLRKSSTIAAVWRIESINDAGVEVTQTQYDIKRRVALQDKNR